METFAKPIVEPLDWRFQPHMTPLTFQNELSVTLMRGCSEMPCMAKLWSFSTSSKHVDLGRPLTK